MQLNDNRTVTNMQFYLTCPAFKGAILPPQPEALLIISVFQLRIHVFVSKLMFSNVINLRAFCALLLYFSWKCSF